ncbi:hypothetical protein LY78DRAFT_662508 [Colletotrichum sublineola]|nr:hypothetical protein LY78DRAFT_662508 [Colletotrichum sublineola]
MKSRHSIAVQYANVITNENIYSQADTFISSKGVPLVFLWLPTIRNSLSSVLRWTGFYPAHI